MYYSSTELNLCLTALRIKILMHCISLKTHIVGLSNVDNTADSAKSVASAAKLKTPRTIQLSGAVTDTATSFDGSKNITISCTSVDGSKVSSTVGSAMNDGSGNAIAETYATKSELQAAALTWGTF